MSETPNPPELPSSPEPPIPYEPSPGEPPESAPYADRYPSLPAPGLPPLRCPLCQGEEFRREESREDSRWGFTSHQMTLMVCRRCRHVLHFYGDHSF